MSSEDLNFVTDGWFHDDENFPYGFDRSGEFTCRQVELLTRRGRAYQALAAGTRQPLSETEKQFVSFCQGAKALETEDELTWERYLKAINRPNYYHSVGLNLKHLDGGRLYAIETD